MSHVLVVLGDMDIGSCDLLIAEIYVAVHHHPVVPHIVIVVSDDGMDPLAGDLLGF